ncbi:DinB family protein [Ferroacidibacillus organovorans]|uniref:DinB-like domain-containing protein n=2 Tax=Ferroacidibacillus organovorans TaxID=1765683 RepID=A0A101XRH0_9BACL|nr:DinB family protein [Ferroacidibacillus organovorans]KUO96194.1 hypothetical protein ATW55_14805 [Ferroacidibacillus organovorans]KYP79344.1 hypothetical protein AYJ22_15095 [Ferroacidibacillus organovorans]OAG88367.1 hypothetical protein AYW79_14475 [Ferroacidibacillus organovorans]OPG14865.1 hypothetical protein B2M26_14855 [Ferroacidibacillus organovorans]
MLATELAIINFREVRRRSIIVWRSVPSDFLKWKPDDSALTIGEVIRHAWSTQKYYYESIKLGQSAPVTHDEFDDIPVTSIEEEISLSVPYFEDFLNYVRQLPNNELESRMIDRSDVGYIRPLGDFLCRIAYHESIHTGQLLQYLRSAGLDRPDIWD